MACDCHREGTEKTQKSILIALLAINAGMFVAELLVGIIAQSSGVIADALDMFADAFVYGVALYASGRSAKAKQTAAALAGYSQVALALIAASDIIRRAIMGSEPSSLLMFLISCVALGANIYCLKLIHNQRKGEIHMRASYIFSKNDVMANAGVIVASLLIFISGSRWPDILVGSVIVWVVLRGGVMILSETRKEMRNNVVSHVSDSKA